MDRDKILSLSKKLDIDSFIIKILMNRGLNTEEEMRAFLRPTPDQIHSWDEMLDMKEAVDLLSFAIESGSRIRIFGDYDIDGVMSTYILHQAIIRAIKQFRKDSGEFFDEEYGIAPEEQVDYQLPHRIYDGYGLNVEMVEKAYDDGVELIITCDNGIAAIEAIAKAKEYDMTVVVTDHHEIRFQMDDVGNALLDDNGDKIEILPDADAIVDPHRKADGYPFKSICGGMVAWKLMKGLYDFYGIPSTEADEFIEYAAFATIGDIMPLVDENRAVVKLGLDRLQYGKVKNIGLKALINATGLKDKVINSTHIGFVLGPCVNATGRLDTAERGVELLEATDAFAAAAIASELVDLNAQRKQLTEAGAEEAKRQARELYANDKVLVIHLPDIHESIAGIIAGRVREAEAKPTFIIADTETTSENGIVKGSGRSIPAYNMFEHMVEAADVFTKFGGHPMAAGFSLCADSIDEMRRRLNENCGLSEEDLIECVDIDLDMSVHYMQRQKIEALDILEPFGEGNRKPKFMRRVKVCGYKRFGKMTPQTHMLLTIMDEKETDSSKSMTAKVFSKADEIEPLLNTDSVIDILYYPAINEFNGRITSEIIIQDWKRSEENG